MEVSIENIINAVNDIDSHPEQLLRAKKNNQQMENVLQQMYMFTMQQDAASKSVEMLSELVLDGMDQELIWQQLDIRNNHAMSHYLTAVANVAALHEHKLSVQIANNNNDNGEEDGEQVQSEIENETLQKGKSTSKIKETKKKNKSKQKGSKEDRFFDVEEMNKFLDLEDAKANMTNGRDDKGQIDYFQTMDDDENNLKYDDFYDNENDGDGSDDDMSGDGEDEEVDDENGGEDSKDVNGLEKHDVEKSNEKSSDEDDDEDDAADDNDDGDPNEMKEKSSFELRQDRRQHQIAVHESQMLDEKPWQLKGEIRAGGRPQNSLLEEILEFESTVRPAPVITEETTLKLEDIIKQRIKDQAWDDVERKIRDNLTAPEYKKQITLDHEKSKMSLSQIYEKDYQREKEKLGGQDADGAEQNPEIAKIERNMQSVLDKLNSLFHFHFTPTTVRPEPQIITNTPALQMEDALPVAVSDANLLAPEEVFKSKVKSLIGKSERTSTDKNRERRKKKIKQHAIHKRLDAKQGGTALEKSKKSKSKLPTKASRSVELIKPDDVKQPKSSKQFFARMQENSSVAAANKKQLQPKTQKRAKDVKL